MSSFQPLGIRSYLSCTSPRADGAVNDIYYFEGIAGNFNRLAKFRRGNEGIYATDVIREDTTEAGDDQANSTNTASFNCAESATDSD